MIRVWVRVMIWDRVMVTVRVIVAVRVRVSKRLLQSLPKTSTLTHNPNPQNKQLKTAHARNIDRGKNYASRRPVW